MTIIQTNLQNINHSMDRYVKRKGTQKKSATYSKKSKYLLSAPFPFKKKFDFGKYSKSHDKYYENRSDNSYPICTQLFAGFSFYFDGFLGEKTRLELVELVRAHGGDVEHFYSRSRVGIIIAKNVCYSKEQQYLKKPSLRVLDPQWILDSIENKSLQPFSKYSIIRDKKSCIDSYLQSKESKNRE
ncbi:uncharacterized protein [Blastocystis hominis]|uniref:BRCT domain-containing protein n=1 Tax=Blastocystis hominis TaxID=12968 RepID=D8M843_BLAHO|nr:uncharacterized protein [Blastocystis hominis]CBK24232.2 unnamed protein product [Blastocystis hominis]|eukprot:XP_012898280.1 uncharacterized protein [Blastocystis hominis]